MKNLFINKSKTLLPINRDQCDNTLLHNRHFS